MPPDGSEPDRQTEDKGGAAAADLHLRRRFFSLPTLIGYAVAIAILGVTSSRVFDIDWRETWELVKSTDPLLYGAALALYYLSFWFRGWRWVLIARSGELDRAPGTKLPSIPVASLIILQGWFANAIAFMRIGDAYRGYAFSKESGVRFSLALGTILGERAQDMVAVLILLIIATIGILIAGTADAPIWVIVGALVLVSFLFVVLIGMRFFGDRISSRLPNRFQSSFQNVLIGALAGFKPRDVPAQLSLGIIGWLLETARLFLVAKGMGIEVDIWVALFAALAGAMLSTIPTPGGFGFVEGGLTGVLVLLGLNHTDAFALTIVDRTISWISIVIIGGGAFFGWQLFRARHPAVLPPAPGVFGESGADSAAVGQDTG